MLIRFKEGTDNVLFIDETKVSGVLFRKRSKFNGPGDEYILVVYGHDMGSTEFIFESKELYNKALEMWCEYEKCKLMPSCINAVNFNPDKRV